MQKRPYDSQYWRQVIRPTILARDPVCQLQLSTRCTGVSTIPHHVVDWKDGGPWYATSNLIGVCSPCNKAAANRRAYQALAHLRSPTITTPSRTW
jgi:5-methylcytosine-specific restriction endonuclease McrA